MCKSEKENDREGVRAFQCQGNSMHFVVCPSFPTNPKGSNSKSRNLIGKELSLQISGLDGELGIIEEINN